MDGGGEVQPYLYKSLGRIANSQQVHESIVIKFADEVCGGF